MRKIFMLLTFLLITNAVYPWGRNGHRIVAAICELYMSDEAKEEMIKIMGPDYLEELAYWPDYIRPEKGWKMAAPWHYTTVNVGQTPEDIRIKYEEDDDINDALEAMDLMIDILQDDPDATKWLEDRMQKNRAKPLRGSTKATALAFLTHIVADIHQPLHVGKNQDRGGNNITVLYFDERTNLHAVWDSKIIDGEQLSYTEFTRFINKTTPAMIAEVQGASIDEWAHESILLREDIYNNIYNYTDKETGLPSFKWDYQHDYIPQVKDRLLKGGLRLAGLLNNILTQK